MEKCVVVRATGEVYHRDCFERAFLREETRPEYDSYNPQDDDECDHCAAPLIDAPDEDDDSDDDDDDDDDD